MSEAASSVSGQGPGGAVARPSRHVELRRSGGIVGRTLVVTLDTADLDDADAARLDQLLADGGLLAGDPVPMPAREAPGRDRFRYLIRVNDEDGERAIDCVEGSEAAQRLAQLIQFMLEYARTHGPTEGKSNG